MCSLISGQGQKQLFHGHGLFLMIFPISNYLTLNLEVILVEKYLKIFYGFEAPLTR